MRPPPAEIVAEARELLEWYIEGFREDHRPYFPLDERWRGIRLRRPAFMIEAEEADEILADLAAADGQFFGPLEGPEVLTQAYVFMNLCPLFGVDVDWQGEGLLCAFRGISDFPPGRFGDGSNTTLVRLPCLSGIPELCVQECLELLDHHFGHDPDQGPLPLDWSLRLLHFEDYMDQFG